VLLVCLAAAHYFIPFGVAEPPASSGVSRTPGVTGVTT
jgi:hypothetical protein